MKMKYVPETWKKSVGENIQFYRVNKGKFYWWRVIHSPLIKTLKKYITLHKDMRILEAGCGSGKISISLGIISGARVYLADFVWSVLYAARLNLKDAEKYFCPVSSFFIRCDIFSPPFKENSFDLITNDGVIEHWLDRKERIMVLRKLYELLKNDGFIAIFVPNDSPLMNFWRKTKYPGLNLGVPQIEYTEEMLREELIAAGFKDVHIDGIDPWASISIWPNYFVLRVISFIFKNLIPLPRNLRIKYGFSLLGIGRK